MVKKTKTQIREERRARKHYGLAKIKRGGKVCWLAKQYANGWALGLSLSDHTRWIRGLRLADIKEVKRVTGCNTVFLHLKNSDNIK